MDSSMGKVSNFCMVLSHFNTLLSPISAFCVDDPLNQPLADLYGIVMGTSHEEPMMRSIPVEWGLFGVGPWDYTTNSQFIYQFWVNGTIRAKPYEGIFTVGMRGASNRS